MQPGTSSRIDCRHTMYSTAPAARTRYAVIPYGKEARSPRCHALRHSAVGCSVSTVRSTVGKSQGRASGEHAHSPYPGSDPLAGWLGWLDGEADGEREMDLRAVEVA